MTLEERMRRRTEADARCLAAYHASGGPAVGAALVAVGGFGRGELGAHSDLDVMLIGEAGVELESVAERIWYPLWDAGERVDHAVRTLAEIGDVADLKLRLSLLDARHLAGDPDVTRRLRTLVLDDWRRSARSRLPALHRLTLDRQDRAGELAHLAVPDLKDAAGGLRDVTVLRALAASWLVDLPHPELNAVRVGLLDVRDALQVLVGRASHRVEPEHWDGLACRLGLADGAAAQAHVRGLGRRAVHLSNRTWRRAEAALARPAAHEGVRRPMLTPLGGGVALANGEVVLARAARPAADPLLTLRAAALAAERDVALAPATASRLARETAPLPTPWPAEARRLLVRLLAAGRGLLPVWETLDAAGALAGILPEWQRIRTLPHASPIHRFTVDRHVLETCVGAGALIRGVGRPDVLMVAALLHDIGKGGLVEHAAAGEPIARTVAERMGFEPHAVDLVARLVRWHLLLAQTATTRDPEDPATVDLVAARLGSVEALDLLLALTEADARATAPQAWTAWRAGLVHDLARRVRAVLGSENPPPVATLEVPVPAEVRDGGVSITAEATPDGTRLTVVAPDRVGLLADVAAVLALQRVPVRAVRAWAQEQYAVSVWELDAGRLDPAVLRDRLRGVVAGRIDATARLRRIGADPVSVVAVRAEASVQATVLEVRTADRPGVVHLVCAALAGLEITVRSAHLDTLGPQAVDVFYLQEAHAGALTDARAAAAAHVVRDALTGARPGAGG